MGYQFTNNASSVLTAQLLAGGLTANITPSDASKFPVPTGVHFFMATLQKSSGEFEIVQCTANPLTGAITIVRAQEGTAAQQFEIGDVFALRLTAGAINTFGQADGTVQIGLNAEKINSIEAGTVAQPNKLLALNGSSLLPAGITGNAATATNASNLGGNDSAFHLDRANHTGASAIPTVQSFAATGTYTKPSSPAPTWLKVTAVGGGGPGGSSGSGHAAGGAGGGGETSVLWILASSVGPTETVTVGGSGASSSFGAHVSAAAGGTGASSSGTPGAAGGTGGTGGTGASYSIPGESGEDGYQLTPTLGGVSSLGGGIGRGGNGGSDSSTVAAEAGASGIVIVEEFY